MTVLAASLVGAVLLFAIARPRGLPEIVVAGPAGLVFVTEVVIALVVYALWRMRN